MKTTKQIATITLILLLGLIAYGLFELAGRWTVSQINLGGESSQGVPGSAIDRLLSKPRGG